MRYSLEGLADVAAIRGEFERALRLAGSAAAVDETIAMSSPTEFTARHQRRLARAWEGLGEEAGAAFEAGRALALDDAIAEALG